jgi:hypothetical protein
MEDFTPDHIRSYRFAVVVIGLASGRSAICARFADQHSADTYAAQVNTIPAVTAAVLDTGVEVAA